MSAVLDLAQIVLGLGDVARRFDVDVLAECDSTNTLLLARAEAGAPSGSVLAADHQTAGRGRRGRAWVAAPGDSLTFSLLWRFAPGTAPAGLSLAVGLAVVRALRKVGAGETAVSQGTALRPTNGPASGRHSTSEADTEPRLKWPNDILLDGRKLGGILVELQPGMPHAAVIGIGINLRLPTAMPAELRAIAAAWPGSGDANGVLAAVLRELLAVLEQFATTGFAALRADWIAHHAFQDAPVRLLADFAAPREGICRGVDTDGALLFESDGQVERILSGELSLRSAA
jgi:BirA family biotin operon repressor/biotin-[acetyl-CoA-carboxylase] ligase